jgi:hypothetical protein
MLQTGQIFDQAFEICLKGVEFVKIKRVSHKPVRGCILILAKSDPRWGSVGLGAGDRLAFVHKKSRPSTHTRAGEPMAIPEEMPTIPN